jgi:alpha-glucosidase
MPGRGRDPQRTPMQWSRAPQAGFTTGTPWLRLSDDWRQRNIDTQAADRASILRFYRELIALRRERPALHRGDYEPLQTKPGVLAFARNFEGERIVVLLNFGASTVILPPSVCPSRSIVLSSTVYTRTELIAEGPLLLGPCEGVVVGLPTPP